MSYALSVSNLEKTYQGGMRALKGVSLTVARGEFFGLLGPNGAGKTTLIGIVTGIVTKTAGTVEIFGLHADEHPDAVKKHVGVVPQEQNFNIFEKPIDIVVNQAGYYGIPRAQALPKARELLARLGIADKADEASMRLSGGMKRRLMIARALIHEPQLLILDEPTAGVDVELRRDMWEFLKTLTAQGITIVLTTHYLEEAEQLCTRLAMITQGTVVAEGSVKDMLSHLTTETVHVGLSSPLADNALETLSAYTPRRIDQSTIALSISPAHGLHDAVLHIHALGSKITEVRTPSGRLEEVFLQLTARV